MKTFSTKFVHQTHLYSTTQFISSGGSSLYSKGVTMNLFFEKDHKNISKNIGNAETKSYGLKVIGAGLPRTGTLSLKSALTQLYSGKCYHMMDVFAGDQEDINIWVKACKGQMKPQDWRDYFEKKNYITGVDFPFSLFYKDIAKAYPEAKVVLSVRDPKTWHGSVFNSIFQLGMLMEKNPTVPFLIRLLDGRNPGPNLMHSLLGERVPEGCEVSFRAAIEGGPEVAEKFFNDWEAEVRRSIPSDKLLVASAKEGWAPLCKFLQLPIPENPYPRVNDTASIQKMIRNIKIVNGIIFYVLPVSFAFGLYVYRAEVAPFCQLVQDSLLHLQQTIVVLYTFYT